MKIENLSKTLDTGTLAAVRGGDNGNSAINTIGQVMNLSVPVKSLSGAGNTDVDVDAKQRASIDNVQLGGDIFALLPFYSRS
jgi:hypothetical protein